MAENVGHFCMLPMPPALSSRTKAALLNEFKWEPGTTIRVRFTEGDPALHARVQAVARQWTGPKMANLTLQFGDDQDADIRIAFGQGRGSWSYLGTMCQQIPLDEPTMNYGWLTPDSGDDELRRVVAHEFGHALGLIHEHQNPHRAIQWDREAVFNDLSGPPNNWDMATIERNIFAKYEPEEISGTDVDPLSIMMYPIPASWTTDGFSADLNRELSETDETFIREAYAW